MQRPNKRHAKSRQKVCAALLKEGKTVNSIAEKHDLDGSLLSLALTRYLKGIARLPRTPELFSALREMEEISGVVIMQGATGVPAKKQAEVVHE